MRSIWDHIQHPVAAVRGSALSNTQVSSSLSFLQEAKGVISTLSDLPQQGQGCHTGIFDREVVCRLSRCGGCSGVHK